MPPGLRLTKSWCSRPGYVPSCKLGAAPARSAMQPSSVSHRRSLQSARKQDVCCLRRRHTHTHIHAAGEPRICATRPWVRFSTLFLGRIDAFRGKKPSAYDMTLARDTGAGDQPQGAGLERSSSFSTAHRRTAHTLPRSAGPFPWRDSSVWRSITREQRTPGWHRGCARADPARHRPACRSHGVRLASLCLLSALYSGALVCSVAQPECTAVEDGKCAAMGAGKSTSSWLQHVWDGHFRPHFRSLSRPWTPHPHPATRPAAGA